MFGDANTVCAPRRREGDFNETTGCPEFCQHRRQASTLNGTYDYVASFSSISEQSKNNWRLVTENTKTLTGKSRFGRQDCTERHPQSGDARGGSRV